MAHPIQEQMKLVEDVKRVISEGSNKPLSYEELKKRKDAFVKASKEHVMNIGDQDMKRRIEGIITSEKIVFEAFMDTKGRGALTNEIILDLMSRLDYFLNKSQELIDIREK